MDRESNPAGPEMSPPGNEFNGINKTGMKYVSGLQTASSVKNCSTQLLQHSHKTCEQTLGFNQKKKKKKGETDLFLPQLDQEFYRSKGIEGIQRFLFLRFGKR